MTINAKLPLPEHNEESIFLGILTVQRKYKKTKNSKKTEVETIKINPNDPFVMKGITPYTVIRRRGMLDRICRKTGWKKTDNISIINIEFLSYHGQGCKEELCKI